jgi:PD-(D/E)XK nuclease superfamily
VTRLRSDITSLTPTKYEAFERCARSFYCRDVLGVPPSDPAPSNDQGLLVHDMLCRVHEHGSCHDAAHVADVLTGHGAGSEAVRELIARHADRCPSAAANDARHEIELARFHRQPPPMFMATARIDALWVHDGLLDARDYKTGRCWHARVCDVPAAQVQAFVLGSAANRHGLRLRLRYEYLQPEVDEDPEPWEPDDEDLACVEETLRSAVERMWAQSDWPGVNDPDICGSCQFRSICRDSAARGVPSWPVLATTED